MTDTNEWYDNDGKVPEGVGPDTVIEVEYRGRMVTVWEDVLPNDNQSLWTLDGSDYDIIRWRFV